MTMTMRTNTKGQVTIPKKLRDEVGIYPETEVQFGLIDGGLIIRSLKSKAEQMQEALDSVVGIATGKWQSTDAYMDLIRGE